MLGFFKSEPLHPAKNIFTRGILSIEKLLFHAENVEIDHCAYASSLEEGSLKLFLILQRTLKMARNIITSTPSSRIRRGNFTPTCTWKLEADVNLFVHPTFIAHP
jgi:hypothetical protein